MLILGFYFCFIMFLLFAVLCLVWVWSLNWKELLDNGWFVRVVLVLWLVSAAFVVFLLGRVDWIVHHELYGFGLQYSPEWAVVYWAALRMIYVFLAAPLVLSIIYLGFEIWRFVRGGRGHLMRAEAQKPVKPLTARPKAAVAEQNHMLISCPKCHRVFSKPLVMLDFSVGKARLVNVCPYCNQVLGCAEEENYSVGFVDLERRRVERK